MDPATLNFAQWTLQAIDPLKNYFTNMESATMDSATMDRSIMDCITMDPQ